MNYRKSTVRVKRARSTSTPPAAPPPARAGTARGARVAYAFVPVAQLPAEPAGGGR
jgi:hypothetical protein